jgi:hypothetical protein
MDEQQGALEGIVAQLKTNWDGSNWAWSDHP